MKKEKTIVEAAEKLANMMVKDENFMTKFGEHLNKQDFKNMASKVWGKVAAIAAPRFGCMLISVIEEDSIYGDDRWSFVILPFSVVANNEQDFFDKGYFPFYYGNHYRSGDDFNLDLDECLDLIFEDWKKLEEEGYVGLNYDYTADYFVPVENFKGLEG